MDREAVREVFPPRREDCLEHWEEKAVERRGEMPLFEKDKSLGQVEIPEIPQIPICILGFARIKFPWILSGEEKR